MARTDITERLVIEGVPYIVRLIDSPTIDDVLVTEAQLQAATIEGFPIDPNRRVDRDVRDFLIRLGVDR